MMRSGRRRIQNSRYRPGNLNLTQMIHVSSQDFPLQQLVGEFPFSFDFDEPGGFEFLDVMGQRGSADRLATAHVRAGGDAMVGADLP